MRETEHYGVASRTRRRVDDDQSLRDARGYDRGVVGISPPRGVQTASVRAMLGELAERFPHESLRVAVTARVRAIRDRAGRLSRSGGGRQHARDQQVLSADALRHRAGRQEDAKMIFFRTNDKGDVKDRHAHERFVRRRYKYRRDGKAHGGRHRIGRVRPHAGNDRPRGLGAAACTQRPISSRCSTRAFLPPTWRFRRFTRSPAKRSAVWPRVSTSSRR